MMPAPDPVQKIRKSLVGATPEQARDVWFVYWKGKVAPKLKGASEEDFMASAENFVSRMVTGEKPLMPQTFGRPEVKMRPSELLRQTPKEMAAKTGGAFALGINRGGARIAGWMEYINELVKTQSTETAEIAQKTMIAKTIANYAPLQDLVEEYTTSPLSTELMRLAGEIVPSALLEEAAAAALLPKLLRGGRYGEAAIEGAVRGTAGAVPFTEDPEGLALYGTVGGAAFGAAIPGFADLWRGGKFAFGAGKEKVFDPVAASLKRRIAERAAKREAKEALPDLSSEVAEAAQRITKHGAKEGGQRVRSLSHEIALKEFGVHGDFAKYQQRKDDLLKQFNEVARASEKVRGVKAAEKVQDVGEYIATQTGAMSREEAASLTEKLVHMRGQLGRPITREERSAFREAFMSDPNVLVMDWIDKYAKKIPPKPTMATKTARKQRAPVVTLSTGEKRVVRGLNKQQNTLFDSTRAAMRGLTLRSFIEPEAVGRMFADEVRELAKARTEEIARKYLSYIGDLDLPPDAKNILVEDAKRVFTELYRKTETDNIIVQHAQKRGRAVQESMRRARKEAEDRAVGGVTPVTQTELRRYESRLEEFADFVGIKVDEVDDLTSIRLSSGMSVEEAAEKWSLENGRYLTEAEEAANPLMQFQQKFGKAPDENEILQIMNDVPLEDIKLTSGQPNVPAAAAPATKLKRHVEKFREAIGRDPIEGERKIMDLLSDSELDTYLKAVKEGGKK